MLLIDDGVTAPGAPVLRTGGVPLVPAGFTWPTCAECEGAMQFLAHVPVDGGAISVFYCQNDPGMCDEWDAASGGNRAYLFTGDLAPADVPAEGERQLGAVTALRSQDGDAPSDAPALGQLGGAPEWLQNDDTPECPSCASSMSFVASLEEGHDPATAANFGGAGLGYVFMCRPCQEAAFSWQC